VSHPTTRVLTVLELLQSRGQYSGPELAGRLEVNVRTVRRYITVLQDLGFPVETIRGRYGAYRLRPGYKLPPLMLTDDEALAVVLSLLAARRLGLGMAAPAVEGALAKVQRVLPLALRDRVQAVQESVVLAPGASAPAEAIPVVGAVMVQLGTAVHESRRVRLRYRSFEGDATDRDLDPYGLVCRAGRWYVAGYCHLRRERRVFRLDRILDVALCEERFERPVDFDSLAEVERGIARSPWGWEIEVLLYTSLEEACKRVPGTLGTVEAVPDGVLLRCSADSLEWMALVLARLGCAFAVREPRELRAAVKQLASRLEQAADAPPGREPEEVRSGSGAMPENVTGNVTGHIIERMLE
jgi:predicted DNA-binding transcriptional regulator YafY